MTAKMYNVLNYADGRQVGVEVDPEVRELRYPPANTLFGIGIDGEFHEIVPKAPPVDGVSGTRPVSVPKALFAPYGGLLQTEEEPIPFGSVWERDEDGVAVAIMCECVLVGTNEALVLYRVVWSDDERTFAMPKDLFLSGAFKPLTLS
jgi:hypothetical protein